MKQYGNFSKDELKTLANDTVFNERIKAREDLSHMLDERDLTPAQKKALLGSALGHPFQVSGILFPCPTAGVYALWQLADSPMVTGGEWTQEKLDEALAILMYGREWKPKEFTGLTTMLEIEPKDALEMLHDIRILCRDALDCFSGVPDGTEQKLNDGFDEFWISQVIVSASQYSHWTPEQILWQVPVTLLFPLLVQSARANGVKNLRKQCKAEQVVCEVEKMMRQRLNELKTGAKNGE